MGFSLHRAVAYSTRKHFGHIFSEVFKCDVNTTDCVRRYYLGEVATAGRCNGGCDQRMITQLRSPTLFTISSSALRCYNYIMGRSSRERARFSGLRMRMVHVHDSTVVLSQERMIKWGGGRGCNFRRFWTGQNNPPVVFYRTFVSAGNTDCLARPCVRASTCVRAIF